MAENKQFISIMKPFPLANYLLLFSVSGEVPGQSHPMIEDTGVYIVVTLANYIIYKAVNEPLSDDWKTEGS
jgi:hypothetical protein